MTAEALKASLGEAVNAINTDDEKNPGHKKIVVSSLSWPKINKNAADAYRLVFHEYLWVMGFDDTNFAVSDGVNVNQIAKSELVATSATVEHAQVLFSYLKDATKIGPCAVSAKYFEEGGDWFFEVTPADGKSLAFQVSSADGAVDSWYDNTSDDGIGAIEVSGLTQSADSFVFAYTANQNGGASSRLTFAFDPENSFVTSAHIEHWQRDLLFWHKLADVTCSW